MLFLLSEVLKEKPGLRAGLTDMKRVVSSVWENDDGEEKFIDLPDPEEELESNAGREDETGMDTNDNQPGDVNIQSNIIDDDDKGINKKSKRGELKMIEDNDKTACETVEPTNVKSKENENKSASSNGWMHRMNLKRGGSDSKSYNPLCRNPLYAQVDR